MHHLSFCHLFILKVKVKNISHRNIARKMKRKFKFSFGSKQPKQISKISGNIVEKYVHGLGADRIVSF